MYQVCVKGAHFGIHVPFLEWWTVCSHGYGKFFTCRSSADVFVVQVAYYPGGLHDILDAYTVLTFLI